MTLSREEVERALIPAVKRGAMVSLTAGTVTGPRHVDGQIVDGPTGPIGQEGYVLNVDGHRLWLPFDGASPSHLAAIAALTSRVAALETAGPWIDCTPGSGVTGSAQVRKLSPTVGEISVSLTGTFVDGDTGGVATIPAALRPSGGAVRVVAQAGGFPALIIFGSTGSVGANHRTGATRTTLYARGTYGLT